MMGLLRDRLDARAPDLPGFGWSPPPPDANYTPEAHARTVAKLIEETVGEPVHLIGNSLGGAVATLVAARRPDLVRTLTLVSPALPVYLPRATNVHLPALAFPFIGQRLARRLGRFPVESRVRATMALCFADPSRVAPERFEQAVAEASRRARLEYESEAMLASLRALIAAYLRRGPSTLWKAAAVVQAPTLLVYGLRDKLVDPEDVGEGGAHLSPVAAARAPGQRARRADGAPRGRCRSGAQVHRPGRQPGHRPAARSGAAPRSLIASVAADHGRRSQPANPGGQAVGGLPGLCPAGGSSRPLPRRDRPAGPGPARPGSLQEGCSSRCGPPRPSARSRRSPA